MNAVGLFSVAAPRAVATDAGQTCHTCGDLVSWMDHLPPLEHGGPVQCSREASLHEQWLSAWDEVGRVPTGSRRARLDRDLERARELICDDNKASHRRWGGEVIRGVRLAARLGVVSSMGRAS